MRVRFSPGKELFIRLLCVCLACVVFKDPGNRILRQKQSAVAVKHGIAKNLTTTKSANSKEFHQQQENPGKPFTEVFQRCCSIQRWTPTTYLSSDKCSQAKRCSKRISGYQDIRTRHQHFHQHPLEFFLFSPFSFYVNLILSHGCCEEVWEPQIICGKMSVFGEFVLRNDAVYLNN